VTIGNNLQDGARITREAVSGQQVQSIDVEDEGLIAHDISTSLEASGHVVVGTVSTAAEALEQAAGRISF